MRWVIPGLIAATLVTVLATWLTESRGVGLFASALFLLTMLLAVIYGLTRFVAWAARR